MTFISNQARAQDEFLSQPFPQVVINITIPQFSTVYKSIVPISAPEKKRSVSHALPTTPWMRGGLGECGGD